MKARSIRPRCLEVLFLLMISLTSSFCTASNDACSKCSCVQEGSVRCFNLEEFPSIETFPRNTTTLDVSWSSGEISIPSDILQHLNKLKYLMVNHNRIKNIPKFITNGYSSLITLIYTHNTIETIENGAFDDLQQLKQLHLSNNRLKEFPIFNKTSSITKLYLRGNPGITKLSRESLEKLPSLESLFMESTGIQEIPAGIFRQNTRLSSLYFNKTSKLTQINEDAFHEDSPLRTLVLDETSVTSLPSRGLENLQYLSLKTVPNFWQLPELESIREVYLSSYNGFLCCAFESGLKYGKDCVMQKPQSTEKYKGQTTPSTPAKDGTTSGFGGGTYPSGRPHTTSGFGGGGFPGGGGGFPGGGGGFPGSGSNSSTKSPTTSGFGGGGFPGGGGGFPGGGGGFPGGGGGFPGGGGGFPGSGGSNSSTQSPTTSGFGGGGFPGGGTHPPTNQYTTPDIPNVHKSTAGPHSVIPHSNNTPNDTSNFHQCKKIPVKCLPKSDAFHPCEDIMGHVLLTMVSLMVGGVALVANLVVALVLLTSQRRLNVTRFLMCNLAFADFSLGFYIFILTCVSIDTHGDYHNYVQQWQNGAGCKILGFLAVFSSELSLFTLVMMTVERFYAIVYAMHMNARLSFRKTVRFMIGGWTFALIMAAVPLTGVSSYNKVAICLPFEVSDPVSTGYVAFLLLVNGASFISVVYLYSRMLCVVVKGGDMEGAPKRNDSKVAKRMAILVFTDMLCWAPIAFFGLLAAFGQTLLTVTQSKVLLVFFFPINSVCNPFLYAFFTKAFKREFFTALSRIGFCKFRALKYNGTLSSFLYSRSRRHQSTVNENSTPKAKHGSTMSLRQSNLELYRKESKAEKVGSVNGICNVGFSGHEEMKTSPGSVRYVVSATGSDQVFFPTTPKATESKESPKSIIKKNSTADNPQRGVFPEDDAKLPGSDTLEKKSTTDSPPPKDKKVKKVSIIDSHHGVFPKDDIHLVQPDTFEKEETKKDRIDIQDKKSEKISIVDSTIEK